jgi:hypothetical protein
MLGKLGVGIGAAAIVLLGAQSAYADARSDYFSGTAAETKGDWNSAAAAYAKVTLEAPTYAEGWKRLATSLYHTGNLSGAADAADRYTALAPTDSAFGAWAKSLRTKVAGTAPVSATEKPLSPTSNAREPRYGIRVLGSWNSGQGSFAYGEQVQSASSASGVPYQASACGGFGGAVEALYERGPHWEFSLGVYPLYWDESKDTSMLDSVSENAREDKSEVSAWALPLIASAGWRQQVAPSLTLIGSAGLGFCLGPDVSVTDQTTQTSANGVETTTADLSYAYSPAFAWRLFGGVEWQSGPSLCLTLGVQAVGADFSTVQGTGSLQTLDQNGNGSTVPTVGPSEALNLLDIGAVFGAAWRF